MSKHPFRFRVICLIWPVYVPILQDYLLLLPLTLAFCKRWRCFVFFYVLFLKQNRFQGCLFRPGTYLSLTKMDLNCEIQLIRLHFSHTVCILIYLNCIFLLAGFLMKCNISQIIYRSHSFSHSSTCGNTLKKCQGLFLM